MIRPDPREFGRKAEKPTAEQRGARFCALACFVLFLIAMGGGLTSEDEAIAAVCVVVAFGALVVGIAAAGEA